MLYRCVCPQKFFPGVYSKTQEVQEGPQNPYCKYNDHILQLGRVLPLHLCALLQPGCLPLRTDVRKEGRPQP